MVDSPSPASADSGPPGAAPPGGLDPVPPSPAGEGSPADGRDEVAAASAGEGGPAPAGIPPGEILKGTPVAPGLALGVVHRKDDDLARAPLERVPQGEIERELNRFHRALVDARRQLTDLKERLSGKVPEDDARILDVHVAYLKDSVFISDVENLILNEQMGLEASIAKVITDFDRIFRLVQNETLRERAVDLRDVGIRVLRHLERDGPRPEGERPAPPEDYVLAARELSIVDMFNLSNERVLGILTEEGGLTSHAAILARSMRIPTITGIDGLLDVAREGDFAIVDATEGLVRLNPDEVLVAQYRRAEATARAEPADGGLPDALETTDGERIALSAACGSLPEVEQAARLGLSGVGLYRTELLFLIGREPPTAETLAHHYRAVIAASQGPVTFRLLHVDSGLGVSYLHDQREQNPALGRAGVRALLSVEPVLRLQLQALSVAAAGATVRVAVPFVTDCGELRRVKEVLFEERLELKKRGREHQADLELGVVVETPAALLGLRDLAQEADFLVIGLDSLVQYLLAADRENHELSSYFETLHPFVLRALMQAVEVSRETGVPLSVFGVSAADPRHVEALIGAGLRSFCVAPVEALALAAELPRIDAAEAARRTQRAARGASLEGVSFADAVRRGYVDV